ncbi:MAG: hypothetical protein ACOX52_00840 [Verrucomicrobiota bacterium]
MLLRPSGEVWQWNNRGRYRYRWEAGFGKQTQLGHNERSSGLDGEDSRRGRRERRRALGGGNAAKSEKFSATILWDPETYAYTAKRYTFPYTRVGLELDHEKLGNRVRVGRLTVARA